MERAVELGHNYTIQRAGNFLTLVKSAQAYEMIGEENYAGALNKFKESDKVFDSMTSQDISGKNRVMVYMNRAANYVNIVEMIKLNKGILGDELSHAETACTYAAEDLDKLSVEDKATWNANITHKLGEIARHRGDYDKAIGFFEKALDITTKGANYEVQRVGTCLNLAYTLVIKPEPEPDTAREIFREVDQYLANGKEFGVYNSLCMPMVETVRKAIE